jgi:hypothetical protein
VSARPTEARSGATWVEGERKSMIMSTIPRGEDQSGREGARSRPEGPNGGHPAWRRHCYDVASASTSRGPTVSIIKYLQGMQMKPPTRPLAALPLNPGSTKMSPTQLAVNPRAAGAAAPPPQGAPAVKGQALAKKPAAYPPVAGTARPLQSGGGPRAGRGQSPAPYTAATGATPGHAHPRCKTNYQAAPESWPWPRNPDSDFPTRQQGFARRRRPQGQLTRTPTPTPSMPIPNKPIASKSAPSQLNPGQSMPRTRRPRHKLPPQQLKS